GAHLRDDEHRRGLRAEQDFLKRLRGGGEGSDEQEEQKTHGPQELPPGARLCHASTVLLQDRDRLGCLVLGRLRITGLARGFRILHELRSLAHAAANVRAGGRARSLHVTTRGLSVLTARRLHVLTTPSLGVLPT